MPKDSSTITDPTLSRTSRETSSGLSFPAKAFLTHAFDGLLNALVSGSHADELSLFKCPDVTHYISNDAIS